VIGKRDDDADEASVLIVEDARGDARESVGYGPHASNQERKIATLVSILFTHPSRQVGRWTGRAIEDDDRLARSRS
jgi:hypothetical protein